MKKKLVGVVLLCTTSFFIGSVMSLKETDRINPEDIIEWHTNGKELSFLTRDGLEWYAYGNCLPDFEYIYGWEDYGSYLELYTESGDCYVIEK